MTAFSLLVAKQVVSGWRQKLSWQMHTLAAGRRPIQDYVSNLIFLLDEDVLCILSSTYKILASGALPSSLARVCPTTEPPPNLRLLTV